MIDLDDFIVRAENTKNARKLYKMTCNECGADRGYQRRHRHGIGLCRPCVSSFIHKGKNVSEETKAKMSASSWIKNKKGHPLLGKKHRDDTKAKLSRAAAKQNKNYLAKHIYNGINGTLNMKSTWEIRYAEWLDSHGVQWTYEPEFKLSNDYIYMPDFKLGNGDIIEIKGYMREDARKKWELFCRDYPDLNKFLLRKEDLKKLGVLS
jgi:ribosomal protein S14